MNGHTPPAIRKRLRDASHREIEIRETPCKHLL